MFTVLEVAPDVSAVSGLPTLTVSVPGDGEGDVEELGESEGDDEGDELGDALVLGESDGDEDVDGDKDEEFPVEGLAVGLSDADGLSDGEADGEREGEAEEEPADELYSSVTAELEVVYPPNESPAVWVPAPPNCVLAVFNAPPLLHAVPLYSSVTA